MSDKAAGRIILELPTEWVWDSRWSKSICFKSYVSEMDHGRQGIVHLHSCHISGSMSYKSILIIWHRFTVGYIRNISGDLLIINMLCQGRNPNHMDKTVLSIYWQSVQLKIYVYIEKFHERCLQNCWKITVAKLILHIFHVDFSCDQTAVWMVQSVCPPSVRLSVTHFLSCFHRGIIIKNQDLLPMT